MQVFNTVSENLQREIRTQYHFSILKKSNIAKQFQFSDELLTQLSMKMQEDLISPQQIVYEQNQFSDKVYFFIEGHVYAFRQKSDLKQCLSNEQVLFTIKGNQQKEIGYEILLFSDQLNYSSNYIKIEIILNIDKLLYSKERVQFQTCILHYVGFLPDIVLVLERKRDIF